MNRETVIDFEDVKLTYSKRHESAPSHKHNEGDFELIFILSGGGAVTLEGAVSKIAPGTVVLVPPYKYYSLEPAGELDCFTVSFSEGGVVPEAYSLLEERLLAESGERGAITTIELHNASSIFERLKSAGTLPEGERALFARLVLSEAIVLLSTAGRDNVITDEGELGVRVLNYINENIDMDMSLDRLARRFFVSKFHLCRAFKEHNGISVHGYITGKRLAFAKSLIESGESASGAAYRVGFGDYSAFYRAYVKAFGHSPTADTKTKEEEKGELRAFK